MQWIAMKDRTPEQEGTYLIYAPSADPDSPLIFVAWWSLGDKMWHLIPAHWARAVTHWMPLPAPPSK